MDDTAKADIVEYPKDKNIAIIDGKAVPIGLRQITPAEILDQLKSVLRLPYLGKEVDKLGMTLIEAALYAAVKKAADGDVDALEKLLNRVMGKPLQQVANLNMTGTLKEFLDGIARAESGAVPGAHTDTDPFSE